MRASVTVTMPSRGSLTCRSMNSATISRTRTLIRRVLARSATTSSSVFRADEPAAGGQQVDLRSTSDESLTLIQHVSAVPCIRSHDGNSNRRAPVQVEMVGLRDRYLEPSPQLPDDRPHYCSFFFERVHIPEQHVELDRRSEHEVEAAAQARGFSRSSKVSMT